MVTSQSPLGAGTGMSLVLTLGVHLVGITKILQDIVYNKKCFYIPYHLGEPP